jgi:hypothetical protein
VLLPKFFGQGRRAALAAFARLPAAVLYPRLCRGLGQYHKKIVLGTSMSGQNPPNFLLWEPNRSSTGRLARISLKLKIFFVFAPITASQSRGLNEKGLAVIKPRRQGNQLQTNNTLFAF